MGPYTTTFVAYAITVVLAAAGLFVVLVLDGAVPFDTPTLASVTRQVAAVFATTVLITFVPWIVWRHLQPIDQPPQYAAPVGALTGLALSDFYLIAVSAMGLSDPVISQVGFMAGATVVGLLSGVIYVRLEARIRLRDQLA